MNLFPVSFGIKTGFNLRGVVSQVERQWRNVAAKMNSRITILEFDQCPFEEHPPLGTVVIHISGFIVVEIVGFDLREVRQRDIAICVALSGFFIQVTIWLKVSLDEWS